VRHETNQDIAASIVGHIRRAALGEALLPFETRVAQGMSRSTANIPGRQPNENGWSAWPNSWCTKSSWTETSSTTVLPSRAGRNSWIGCWVRSWTRYLGSLGMPSGRSRA